jgi:hypothetical protein
MRVVQILQQDLLKEAAFSQYELGKLAQKKVVSSEEREKVDRDAELKMRNLIIYVRTLALHCKRLLDAALDTSTRIALLLCEKERERQKEILLFQKEKPKLEEGVDMEEDGKAVENNQTLSNRTQHAATAAHGKERTGEEEEEEQQQEEEEDGGSLPLDVKIKEAVEQGVVLRILRPLATAMCLFLDDAVVSANDDNFRLLDAMSSSLLPLLKSIGIASHFPPWADLQ